MADEDLEDGIHGVLSHSKNIYRVLVVLSVVIGFGWSLPIDDNEISSRQNTDEEILDKWTLSSIEDPGEFGLFFEGDMYTNSPMSFRNILANETTRWKYGIVPYEFNKTVSCKNRKAILSAMEQFHKFTCVRFRGRRDGDEDYVHINTAKRGCWSHAGRKGAGKQFLNLNSAHCFSKIGKAIHELMHTLGLKHEQAREDRDEYVDIFWDNIKYSYKGNFEKAASNTTVTFRLPYNYGSLMHYPSSAFANDTTKPTILPKDRTKNIGQREKFMFDFGRSMPIDDNELMQSLSEDPGEFGIFFEGDMYVDDPISLRNVLANETTRWESGIVPYEIDETVSEKDRKKILKAMEQFHQFTCVRFRDRGEEDENYVHITTGKRGCWSTVGKKGNGEQFLNLNSERCFTQKGKAIHELMHTLGLKHEQSREDRDEYVDIFWDNIIEGKGKNFEKADPNTTVTFGLPYDHGSLMHYPSDAFAKNKDKPTIQAKDKTKKIGQREKFSRYDLIKINTMYNCSITSSRYL